MAILLGAASLMVIARSGYDQRPIGYADRMCGVIAGADRVNARDDWPPTTRPNRAEPDRSTATTSVIVWLLTPVAIGVAIVSAVVLVVNNLF